MALAGIKRKKKRLEFLSVFVCWCGRRDSNSHTSRRQNLNLVRLPISPRPRDETRDYTQSILLCKQSLA